LDKVMLLVGMLRVLRLLSLCFGRT